MTKCLRSKLALYISTEKFCVVIHVGFHAILSRVNATTHGGLRSQYFYNYFLFILQDYLFQFYKKGFHLSLNFSNF